MKNNRIKIALQKSGRLNDESFKLLERCGIKTRKSERRLVIYSENFPLDILLVRDDDIPKLIINDICDFGIVGNNILQEISLENSYLPNKLGIETIRTLNFGYCRLSIAIPDNLYYENIHDLEKRRIATTYPCLLNKFLKEKNINAQIITLNGSVEIAPNLEISDAICDLVSTGATLEINGLHEVETILESTAVLIKTTKKLSEHKQKTADLFLRRIDGVISSDGAKYIMFHCLKTKLEEITPLMSGMESPTILPLEGNNKKVAIHAVCRENIFWETLEKLKFIGASSILVTPIEKMIV